MKESYIIAGVVVGTAALIAAGALVAGKMDQSAQIGQSAGARAVVASRSHSWGDIPINGGKVEALFEIANEGTEALQLFNVSTSCMCTTAQLEVSGTRSPEFGMHGKVQYVTEVPAGQTARLKVVFDPAFHGPQGVGAVTRQVRMQTNDAAQPELMFTLEGTVV